MSDVDHGASVRTICTVEQIPLHSSPAPAADCQDTPWTTTGDTSSRTYRGHRLVVIAEADGPYSWQTWSPADEWAPIADGESASATFARCYAEESAERGDGPATTARSLSSDLTGAVDP